MDFLKILRSLEEFVYEVVTWLVTYPATLWQVIRHPIESGRRVERECDKPPDAQFTTLLSPTLFLMLSVLLSHALELALHVALANAVGGGLAHLVLGSEQGLLAYRSISFAVWPLAGSVFLLHHQGVPINRQTLRRPFFGQCYLITPCAIGMSTADIFLRMPERALQIAGLAMLAAVCAWYMLVQARWFHEEMKRSWWHATRVTLQVLVIGMAINVATVLLLVGTGEVDVPKAEEVGVSPSVSPPSG